MTDSEYGPVDSKRSLELSDDAARQIWGKPWRMPSMEEWEELLNKCTWTWTTQNKTKGYKVTGPNGKSIFLPSSGCWWGDSLEKEGTINYWSSTLDDEYPNDAYILYGADYLEPDISRASRYEGLVIRPVLDNPYFK